MAIAEQCPEYYNCGYIKWRIKRPDLRMAPLPADGDCGKSVDECGRLDPSVDLDVDTYGPETRAELENTFPEISNQNNRPPKRLVGIGS